MVNILCLICPHSACFIFTTEDNYWTGYSSPASGSASRQLLLHLKPAHYTITPWRLKAEALCAFVGLWKVRKSFKVMDFAAARACNARRPWKSGSWLWHLPGRVSVFSCVHRTSYRMKGFKWTSPVRVLTTVLRPLLPVHSSHALKHRADSPQTAGELMAKVLFIPEKLLLTQKGLSGWSNNPSMIKLLFFGAN